MDGSLTGASESDVDKQQLTARVPLNGCPRGLTPNFPAAMEDCNLDAVKRPSCRIYHTPKTGRVVGLPLSKYSRAQHRTLLSAFQRRAAPRSMAFTKVTTQAAHLCESRRPGAAASRFWAAAGVSSGLVDGVKAPCPISKLPEIEARTVPRTGKHCPRTWRDGTPPRTICAPLRPISTVHRLLYPVSCGHDL